MPKTLDKKKYGVSNGNDPITDKMIGNALRHIGEGDLSREDYRQAVSDFEAAIGSYNDAMRYLGKDDPLRKDLAKLVGQTEADLGEAQKMDHLYRGTAGYSKLGKWVVRKLREWQVMGMFVFAILFAMPSITGNFIGVSSNAPFFGVLFFFLGIAGTYVLIWRRFLIRRFMDKY